MKECRSCRVSQPVTEFWNDKRSKDGLGSYCKPCARERHNAWRKANPDKIRKNWNSASQRHVRATGWRWKHYRLTEEAFNAMLVASGGRCAICHKERELVVDHDHATGEVRGLLCHHCNKALGFLGDSVAVATAAVLYLTERSGAVVARQPHKLEAVGSTPTSATT